MQYHKGQLIVMRPNAVVFKVEDDNPHSTPEQSDDLLAILEVDMCWDSVSPAFANLSETLRLQGVPDVDELDWAICAPVTMNEGALLSDNPPTVYLVRLDQVLGVTEMTPN